MKKLKEMAAVLLFTSLAAGFSASVMADAQTAASVPAAYLKHSVHWCHLFDPDGLQLPPIPGMGWPWCA